MRKGPSILRHPYSKIDDFPKWISKRFSKTSIFSSGSPVGGTCIAFPTCAQRRVWHVEHATENSEAASFDFPFSVVCCDPESRNETEAPLKHILMISQARWRHPSNVFLMILHVLSTLFSARKGPPRWRHPYSKIDDFPFGRFNRVSKTKQVYR